MNEAVAATVVPEQELRWKCRRGMLELDLLLQRFVDSCYRDLTPQDSARLLQLLDYPDQVLQDMLINGTPSSDSAITDIARRIRECPRRPG